MSIAMTDRLEIADLVVRLGRLLDDRRFDEVATVYADDVVVRTPRGELHGVDEVIAFLHRFHVEDEHTQHVQSGVLVTADDGRVEASLSQVVHYYRTGQPPHRRSGLRAAYQAVRTPSGWRFAEGNITLAWTEPAAG